jgi:hypothetical protein
LINAQSRKWRPAIPKEAQPVPVPPATMSDTNKSMPLASLLLGIIACLLKLVFEYSIYPYKKVMMKMMVQPIILPSAFDTRTKQSTMHHDYNNIGPSFY